MTPNDPFPVVDPNEHAPLESTRRNRSGSADGNVAGVLLAAGASRRYGDRNKLLESAGGDPVVRRAVRTLLESPLESVTVVLGHEAERVGAAIEVLPVETVRNDAHERGQSTSVRTGIKALPPKADAAVVALGDQPAVDPASVRALVRAYRSGAGTALAAACDGVRGNPVLFGRRHFEALTALEGDRGGRAILLADDTEAALVETGDPGVRADLDRPSDREAIRTLLENGGGAADR